MHVSNYCAIIIIIIWYYWTKMGRPESDDRLVITLSRSIDSIKWLLLKQSRRTVARSNFLDNLHDHMILIDLGWYQKLAQIQTDLEQLLCGVSSERIPNLKHSFCICLTGVALLKGPM